MTTLEILRANRESAQESVNFAALKKEFAKVAAKHFAPYRENQLTNLFKGATPEQLKNEIDAFENDTKNGTRLIISVGSSEKLQGNKIVDADGKVLFEGITAFAVLKSTNKEGETIREKQLYSAPFVPMTANDNDRVINYWLSYRSTIEESFAYITETENAKRDKEDKVLAAAAALLGMTVEELKAKKAQK